MIEVSSNNKKEADFSRFGLVYFVLVHLCLIVLLSSAIVSMASVRRRLFLIIGRDFDHMSFAGFMDELGRYVF